MLDRIDVTVVIDIARKAGKAIMDVYNSEAFDISLKADKSPLTEADKRSNDIIIDQLTKQYPDIPYLSEETKQTAYEQRKSWEYFWVIDPLDGTKEFIKKNGEFTVNIALIHRDKPVLGVVDVPAKGLTYYAVEGQGSYRIGKNGGKQRLATVLPPADSIVIVGSRSHTSPEVEAFVALKKKTYDTVEFIPAGSSLKFCLVAEGKAHVYPRLGPTMEWDTAAAQAIVEQAGGEVLEYETGRPLVYNKKDLLNPWFVVR